MAEKSADCELPATGDSFDEEDDFEIIPDNEAMASRVCDPQINDELIGETGVPAEDKARSYETEEVKGEVDESVQHAMSSKPKSQKEEITFKLTEMPKGSGRWLIQIGDVKEKLPEEIKITSESETKISKDEDNNVVLITAQNKYCIRENDGKLVFHHVEHQVSEQGDLPGGIRENIQQTNKKPEHDSDMYKLAYEMQGQVMKTDNVSNNLEPKTQIIKGQDQSSGFVENAEHFVKIDTRKGSENAIESISELSHIGETDNMNVSTDLEKKNDRRSSPELEKTLLGVGAPGTSDKSDKHISERVGIFHDEIENIQREFISSSTKSSEYSHQQTTDVVDHKTNCPNEEECITRLEGKDTISSGTEKSPLSTVSVVNNPAKTSTFRNQTWPIAGAEGTGISNRDQQKQSCDEKTPKVPSCTPDKNEVKESKTDNSHEEEYESCFQVPFITEVILNNSEEKAKLKDRFPGLHCEFNVRNETKYCKLCGSYQDYSAAKDYILKVPSFYGSVEIEWKHFKNSEKIKNKEKILQTLLKEARKEYTETDGYWFRVENTKLYTVSKSQSLAESLAGKIKNGIIYKEEMLTGEMRQPNYVETVKMIISEHFTDEVECEVDQDTYKLRLVGLKVSIHSLLDYIKLVPKTVQILDRDMLDYIVEKAGQQSGGRVNLTPLMVNDKQGICIKGPSLCVGEIFKYIAELQKKLVHSTVALTSRSQSQFLENEGGKHFLQSVKDRYEVEVVEEMLEVPANDRFEETQWILPAGHQIVVTTRNFGEVQADMRLCPDVKGNEGSSQQYRHLKNIQTMTLPSNRLEGKRKHECHETLDRMLQEAKKRGLITVSMLLIEDECWGSVKQQFKIFLYAVTQFLSSSEVVPMTFTFCMHESGQYKEATKITSNYLSPERSGMGRLNVTLTKGNICDQQVDVLVNTTNSSLDMKATAVSAMVAARAGLPELQEKCRLHLKQRESLKPWEFVVTDGCKLKFRYIFHGVPEIWNTKDGIKQLQNFIYRCLVKCNELKMKSIAFPAIGTGKLKYPPKEVAAAFFEAARYFEMKIPHAYLKDMTIVIYEKDEEIYKDFQKVEQVEKGYRQQCSIDGVSVCVRQGDILRLMADTVVYFWEMKVLESAKTSVSPFMSWLGTQVNEEFSQKCSGHTFETRGGNLNASTILHVPYRNDAGKLASAFKEAISFIRNQGAVTSAVFFDKKHPMLKHVGSIPEALIKAVKSESQTDNLKLLSIIVEDEKISQSIQRGLEGYRIKEQQPHGELHADGDVNVTTLPVETSKKGLKLIGLIENVDKARLEIEIKLTEIEGQHMTMSSQGQSALEPPGAMAISAEERGYPTTDKEKDISTQRKGYSAANTNTSVEGREYSKTDKEKDICAQKREHSETEIGQPEEEKGYPHRKKQKDGNTHTKVDKKEQELQGARPKQLSDNKKIGQSSINKESAQQVDKNMPRVYPTLDVDPDETFCIEVEISEARDNDSHGNLFKDMFKQPFPVPPPRLIYPFENRTKALLVCQSCDDADKLEQFKEKTSKGRKYLFKRFQPQSLQMCQITLSTANLESLTKISTLEEIEEKLEEMGFVETSGVKDEPSLTVQTYSLAQASLIQDYLQHLIDTSTKTNVSDSAYQHVDTISDVNPTVWKIVNMYLTKHLTEIKQQNANVYFDNCSIVIDWGSKKGINLSDFFEAVDYYKSVHTEEIKPSKDDSTEVYKAWCNDIKDVQMTDCCFYDEETKCFIAFGNSYDVIQKVKHQLGIKQGTVKQTARSRGRNFGVQQVELNDDVNPVPLPISSGASDLRPPLPDPIATSDFRPPLPISSGTSDFRPPLPDPIATSDFRQPLSDPVSTSGVRPKNINKTFNWSEDAQEVKKYTTVEGIRVYVYIANILKLPVDCIVNAANDTLQHGGGVALVIARAAGRRLTEEGNCYVRQYGLLPVGTACTTTAGHLPYNYVIHAVGPRWTDYWPHTVENVKRCESLLQNAILSSFTEATNRGQKTIALPAISSAIFGVPEEMCAVQYARAIQKYSLGMPSDEKRLKEIHFIDKNPSIVRLIQKTFQTMIKERKETDYDFMRYVKQSPSQKSWNSYSPTSERSDPSKQKQSQSLVLYATRHNFVLKSSNGSESYVYSGNILEVYKRHVSAIVCSEDDLGRGKGGLALSLIKKAEGFSYRSEKNKAFASKKPAGQIVVCNGQGTGYNHVLHAILWSSGHSGSHMVHQKDIVLKAYRNIFFEAFKLGIKSVAIPVLGTGSYKAITLEESAEAFLTAYDELCNTNMKGGKLSVYLICGEHRAMMVVIDVFKKLLQKEEFETGRDATTQSSGTGRDTAIQNSGTGRDTAIQDSGSGKDTATQNSGTGRDTSTQDSGGDRDSVDVEKEGSEGAAENCAICMDAITQKKILPCGHIFCTDCIDNYLNNYKKACPTCGKACGIIIGDQPHGNMNVEFKYSSCAGYESYGRIEITYSFHDGRQGPEHPEPGSPYKGIIRTAYLPDNEEGRKILELLRIAFDRKLIFTIGHSRTTGKEGVITWNDIHHKTNPRPHANFGYPDPGYFQRVKEELAVKGVTVDDIPELGGRRATRSGSRY